MTQSSNPTARAAPAQPPPTKSVAAQAGRQASAWQEDPEGVPAALTASSDATATSKTARTKDADAAALPRDPSAPTSAPKYHVQSLDDSYQVFGVDAIWHNQYAGPQSDFVAFRKQYDCDINVLIFKVAEHVRKGVYTVVSMNATPHMLTVVCACERFQNEFPSNMWDDPLG